MIAKLIALFIVGVFLTGSWILMQPEVEQKQIQKVKANGDMRSTRALL